jgi:hypothetical protein
LVTGASGSAALAEHVCAGLLTPSACLSADPAVFVVLGVSLTLFGAAPTGDDTGLEKRPNDLCVPFGLSGKDAARRGADIGAIEIGPDAANEVRDSLFAEASIRTGGADRGAGEALLHAARERLLSASLGVRSQHLADRHLSLLKVECPLRTRLVLEAAQKHSRASRASAWWTAWLPREHSSAWRRRRQVSRKKQVKPLNSRAR